MTPHSLRPSGTKLWFRRASAVWLRRGLVLLALALAGTGVLCLRLVLESHEALNTGNHLLAQDQPHAALRYFVIAARAYAPGNPYSTEARLQLGAMANQAQNQTDRDFALTAYRSLRASILATSSLVISDPAGLEQANRGIATILADRSRSSTEMHLERRERVASSKQQLQATHRPSIAGGLLVIVGFLLWVFSSINFLRRGLDAESRFLRATALPLGAAALLGYGLLAAGLWLA